MNMNHFCNKKTVVSFVLSLFVFFIHFVVFSAFRNVGKAFDATVKVLMPFTHVAVPLFFMISGAMFFRDYSFSLTLKKWKKRFFTLVVPYLFWNSVWYLVGLFGYYTPIAAFTGGVKVAFSAETAMKGIFLHAQFLPFWFMKYLIVFVALSPVIFLFIRQKWSGIAVIVGMYALYALEVLESEMIIYYMIGSWIGLHGFACFSTRKQKKYAFAGFAVYLICCVVHYFEPKFVELCSVRWIYPVITAVSCYAFWISFDRFELKRYPRFMKESFLIYAMHSLVGAAIAKVLRIVLPSGSIGLISAVVMSFASTILFICIFGRILEKYAPSVKRFIAGR